MEAHWWIISSIACLICEVIRRLVFLKPRKVDGMRRLLLSEVIDLVKAMKGRQDKINVIETNMCPGLVGLLRMNFDDQLELDINIDIEFKRRKANDSLVSLNHSSKMWKSFTKQSLITRSKKDLRFKAMLESLEPREAELFLLAAKKQLRLGISKQTLRRSFPSIFKSTK